MRLQSTSPCIAAGTYLTQANGAGTSSTTLIVDDAYVLPRRHLGIVAVGDTGRPR
ncbi:MAG: hypothetical protein MZV70_03575 [Desulfobacterales bacterium]|nr:hypothetical protein [Desulfobacterales bacterium]